MTPAGRTLLCVGLCVAMAIGALAACTGARLTNADGVLRATPEAIDFGRVPIGTIARRTVRITNASRGDVAASMVASAPFATSNSPSSELRISTGAFVDVEVSLQPSATGELSGALNVKTDTGELRVPLTANQVPEVECPPTPKCSERVDLPPDTDPCATRKLADGTACQDPCLVDGRCTDGECTGEPVSCDDGDACTVDACNDQVGCVRSDRNCEAELVPDPCHAAFCDPATGCGLNPVADGTRCGRNDCQTAHVCLSGTCALVPATEGSECGDPSPCQTTGVCRDAACVRPPAERLHKLWSYAPPDASVGLFGPDDAGRVFVTEWRQSGEATNGSLRVLEARTGAVLAVNPTISPFAPVFVDSGRLYGWREGGVMAIDASSGAVLWDTDLLLALHGDLDLSPGQLEPRGVSITAMVADARGGVSALLNAEAWDLSKHTYVPLGSWWVRIDSGTGAIVRATRWGGPTSEAVTDGKGRIYFAEQQIDDQGQSTARLGALLPDGGLEIIDDTSLSRIAITSARAGHLTATAGYPIGDHLYWGPRTHGGVVVLSKADLGSSTSGAALGNRFGFIRGRPHGESSIELRAFDVDTGLELARFFLPTNTWNDNQLSPLTMIRGDVALFSAPDPSSTTFEVELRGYAADYSTFVCALEDSTPYLYARAGTNLWIGSDGRNRIDAFDVPGLEPLAHSK